MKKFLTVLLTITLYFNLFTTAHASANLGGWTLGNPIAQGASAIVNGTKTAVINGANVIKNSTAKITPTATQVAKVLARGGAGYALSVAVEQLLGAVDWVLDPANNQIIVTKQYSGTDLSVYKQMCIQKINTDYADNPTLRNNYLANVRIVERTNPLRAVCLSKLYGTDVNMAEYPITGEEDNKKTYPLDMFASQVISNAQSGDAQAQAATIAAAQDIINEAETDNTKARPIVNQLEANAETATQEEAQGQAKPQADPVTGEQAPPLDLSLEFPKFCSWAPVVCEAAQVVLTFPNTLIEWWETANTKAEEWALSISEAWTAVKEWASSEKEPEDTELEIPEQEQPDIDTDIAFGGSCPSDREAEVNMGVGIIKLPISYEPICTTVSTAKPVLIFVGFFIAALIIGGVKTE